MNQPSMPDLETTFKRIPMLSSNRIEDLQVKRLSGFTNHNFHIKGAHADWVLRIPRAETNQFIDRAIEAHNRDIAVLMGLAPECIWRDNTGLSLCQTLSNTRPIKPLDLQNSQICESLVSKLTRLHQCGAEFGGRVNLEELLTGFYQLTQKPQQRLLKSSYHKAKKKIKNLAQEDGVPVPSHNDLVLENILLDDTKRIWLIDWEYSSMASPTGIWQPYVMLRTSVISSQPSC